MKKLTHVTSSGEVRMVDISPKRVVHREALASGKIHLQPQTISLIQGLQLKKGDVLAVARVAAISAAKKTSDLIPLCHNIPLSHVDVQFSVKESLIEISARVRSQGKTGVEMEALTAVAVAALTIYDMCKAADNKMVIGDIYLVEKKKNEIQD